ncbi:hypothetical protein ATCCBAA256_16690 [Mycobacterium montefiorense]|nr:hypothetical protein ATCCBAA256_16690 [Mycobacterium montefiorense]
MAQVLDIAPLRSLVAVADCGGFHRAAAALHLSQSAVSQHLRKIESVLGEPVVQRCGRGVLFTEIGQRVLRHARTILAAHDAALDDLGATEQRVLTVGATEHGADVMLPARPAYWPTGFPTGARASGWTATSRWRTRSTGVWSTWRSCWTGRVWIALMRRESLRCSGCQRGPARFDGLIRCHW